MSIPCNFIDQSTLNVYFGDGYTFEATSAADVFKKVRQSIENGKSSELFAQHVTLYGEVFERSEHKNVTFKEMSDLISSKIDAKLWSLFDEISKNSQQENLWRA